MGLQDKFKRGKTAGAQDNSESAGDDWITYAENCIGDDNMKKIRSKVGEEHFDKYEKKAREKLSSSGKTKESEDSRNSDTAQVYTNKNAKGGMNSGMSAESYDTGDSDSEAINSQNLMDSNKMESGGMKSRTSGSGSC